MARFELKDGKLHVDGVEIGAAAFLSAVHPLVAKYLPRVREMVRGLDLGGKDGTVMTNAIIQGSAVHMIIHDEIQMAQERDERRHLSILENDLEHIGGNPYNPFDDMVRKVEAWQWPKASDRAADDGVMAAIYDFDDYDPQECTCHLGHPPCSWCVSEDNPSNHNNCDRYCGHKACTAWVGHPDNPATKTDKLIATEATEQDKALDPDAVQRAHRDFMRGL